MIFFSIIALCMRATGYRSPILQHNRVFVCFSEKGDLLLISQWKFFSKWMVSAECFVFNHGTTCRYFSGIPRRHNTRIAGIIICVHIQVDHHKRERHISSFLVDSVIEDEHTNCN